jgi:pentapeptide MXKDX repeat protein
MNMNMNKTKEVLITENNFTKSKIYDKPNTQCRHCSILLYFKNIYSLCCSRDSQIDKTQHHPITTQTTYITPLETTNHRNISNTLIDNDKKNDFIWVGLGLQLPLKHITRQKISKNFINIDTINKDSINKDTINKDSINKYTINKDTINKDFINKNSINKDSINKDSINKDTINKDSINITNVLGDTNKEDEFTWVELGAQFPSQV